MSAFPLSKPYALTAKELREIVSRAAGRAPQDNQSGRGRMGDNGPKCECGHGQAYHVTSEDGEECTFGMDASKPKGYCDCTKFKELAPKQPDAEAC